MAKDPAFPNRLQREMLKKQMSRSDLAREVFGTEVNSKGHTVARNRSQVTRWLKGDVQPDPQRLERLAEVFGMEPSELLSTGRAPLQPEVEMIQVGDGKVKLRIDKVVPFAVATKVLNMIAEAGDV